MTDAGDDARITEDTLLGGQVRLLQPREGYRVGIDPVFLAAAVPAIPGDLVLDVGAGVGAASLCLAWREPGCHVRGIELQRDLVRLAGGNIELNQMMGRVDAMVGDLMHPPPRLSPGSFAHVMANPPYLPADAATAPPDAGKAASQVEGAARLADWVRFCLTMTRPKGTVVFIHRADRIESLLAELHDRAGEIVVFPLWAGEDRPASRVVVRARKGAAAPTRLLRGLVLHEADGRYTEAAEAVLRGGMALEL